MNQACSSSSQASAPRCLVTQLASKTASRQWAFTSNRRTLGIPCCFDHQRVETQSKITKWQACRPSLAARSRGASRGSAASNTATYSSAAPSSLSPSSSLSPPQRRTCRHDSITWSFHPPLRPHSFPPTLVSPSAGLVSGNWLAYPTVTPTHPGPKPPPPPPQIPTTVLGPS